MIRIFESILNTPPGIIISLLTMWELLSAGLSDYMNRKVSDAIWIVMGGLGIVGLYLYPEPAIAFIAGIGGAIAIAIVYYAMGAGGADAKCIMALGLVFGAHRVYFIPMMLLLTMGAMWIYKKKVSQKDCPLILVMFFTTLITWIYFYVIG